MKCGKYQVWINALVSNNCLVTDSGKFQALGTGEINTLEDIKNNLQHDNYNVIFSSDSMIEVVSFMSYAYTKFVRFLIFNSICGLGPRDKIHGGDLYQTKYLITYTMMKNYISDID